MPIEPELLYEAKPSTIARVNGIYPEGKLSNWLIPRSGAFKQSQPEKLPCVLPLGLKVLHTSPQHTGIAKCSSQSHIPDQICRMVNMVAFLFR